ncbi:UDP-glucose 4-epimerase GalE [Acetobacterium wieringae]|uniref:UDP-glucose 4-epimerase n=1 Tax=Acetobacterium wieringae TaxID=52694 RepID=A0ABY6HCS7_9FIRM|nr:UDP-glucose 4-epimerase GalE [Acetobacterium wieringae]UYO61749.1 UDP-glucose 4-epimerase GalE [Acetobacterium wieringae]VUZ28151.1 UDP-glucose 4-epimerase [Acetobacterium wieringae]
MKILVCGGAGYIGSHVVRVLVERGYQVVVLDNFSTGHLGAVPKEAVIEEGDIRDRVFLGQVFQAHPIDCVMHFCANSLVGESMVEPLKYYHNNVYGTICLLETMVEQEVTRFVFSSTAAVYGEPEQSPITENSSKKPTNTYGETKLAVEKMLPWLDQAYGLKSMTFRYFNAAGAHPSGEIGEDHNPETHLLPLILKTALGQRDKISIFGEDYPTPDGSCIRDYIHVMDIAAAHILGMEKLLAGGESNIYNLGDGKGFSVKEVIDRTRAITGKAFAVEIADRRAGDPVELIASSEKAHQELGWKPAHSDLDTIIKTAWKWHQNHPQGYGE